MASLALVVVACGSDETSSESPDASRPSAVDAAPSRVDGATASADPPCVDLADAPPAARVAGPDDGTYAQVESRATSATPACLPDGPAPAAFAYYLRLDRTHAWPYRRHYATLSACQTAAFDTGGTVEDLTSVELRACGPSYQTAAGSFRQSAYLVPDDVGDGYSPLFTFSGHGPTDPRWDEIIVSDLRSNAPFTTVPDDLTFTRYRRPR
jgi:hypothetical protein